VKISPQLAIYTLTLDLHGYDTLEHVSKIVSQMVVNHGDPWDPNPKKKTIANKNKSKKVVN